MHVSSLTDHQQLVMWAELLVILLVARVLGAAFRRFGQPAVVGELAAGVLLGPSVLGQLWPHGFDWLFPVDKAQSGALNAIGWLGVAFLLILTGFETDLGIVRRLGRSAMSVGVGGLILPFLCRLAVGATMPADFVGPHAHRGVFTLFIGVGLSISSLPVIAKILGDLGFMRRNFGQVTVAVGMVNDLIGWMALGLIAGLASSGSFSLARLGLTVVAVAVLVAAVFTGGQRGVDAVLRQVRRRTESVIEPLAVTIVVALIVATVAEAVHIEAVLGAFLAGIVLGRSRFQHPQVGRHLESITMGVLAPVFFAIAGLRLDLGSLAKPATLMWTGVVIVVAVGSKVVGAYAGARVGGLQHREGLALGAGLNARGAVEVVIATVGLTMGVLSQSAYTTIVVMAIITSMMAPPFLRLAVRNWRGSDEERARLDREDLLGRNLLVRPGRLLLPSRGRPNSIVAAQVLNLAWPEDVGVTVLSVGGEEGEPGLDPVASVFEGRDVEFRRASRGETLSTILSEARLGYQAIGVGVADTGTDSQLLSPVVDELMADAPVPLVIVRRARGLSTPTPPAFTRALVPVTGSPSSRTAQEVAFSVARQLGTDIVLAHVDDRPPATGTGEERGPSRRQARPAAGNELGRPALGVTDRVVEQALALAREFDVEAGTMVRTGTSTADEILVAAAECDADLIVLGATVRRLDGAPFLGHTVEHVLENADATVVVVTTPDVTAVPASPS